MYENPRSDETMYTSYRKSRSHSTTDLSRSVEDNYSRCPPGYTTLSRTNRLPAVQSTAKSPLKRTQSYLTEEVRREFECGYMSTSAPRNTTVSPLQLIRQKKQLQQTQEHSPLPAYGSNNFVKKLVATLEKKQEEPVQEATTGNQRRGCEYASLSIVEARVTSPPVPPRHVPINRFRESCSSGFQNKQVKGGQTFNRFVPNRLASLNEQFEEDDYTTEEEYDEDVEYDSLSSRDSPDFYWHSINQEPPAVPRTPTPEPKDDKSAVGGAKRVLKNVFTSLMSWRNKSKNNSANDNNVKDDLPRGTRDYYAARPSLGEEMRAFRSGTMTRLYERSKSRDIPIPETRPLANTLVSRDLDHHREKKNSIATIRPVYGIGNSWSNKNPVAYCADDTRHYETMAEAVPEKTSYGMSYSRQHAQPPALPVHRVRSTSPDSLMRPRDTLKRSSRGESTTSSICSSTSSSSVQLRCKNGSAESFYDVPRTRPVLPRLAPALVNYETIKFQTNKRSSQPDYENFSETDYDDRRLQCSAFTTF